MSKHVLIVGCGQLGSRHLQAIASLSEVSSVDVFDPNPQSLATGQARVKELSDLNPRITFVWHTRLADCRKQGDLCVVATQAEGRCDLVKKVAGDLRYRNFLIEKIVSQSVAAYEDLMQYGEAQGIKIWVNCKNRDYGIHRYIKSKLNPQEKFVMSVIGGNHGLANNGIHEADIFVFYDGSDRIDLVGANLDKILHVSKRGTHVYDFTGSIQGRSPKGNELILNFMASHEGPGLLTLTSASSRFILDYYRQFAYESYLATDWDWKIIPFSENWLVSHMTKSFAADILSKGSCSLPTLKQCFPAHQFILSALLPQANQLLKKNDDVVSVT